MRKFDTFTADVKIDLLESYVAFAKQEIAELGNPENLPLLEIARSYDHTFEVTIDDFNELVDVVTIVAWTGQHPPRLPR